MKGNVQVIRKKRSYATEFKRDLVKLFEGGKFSVLQLSKLYGVSQELIYLWIYKFSHFNEKGYRVIEMKHSSTSKVTELEQKVKELERLVGQKQIKIDFLEEMINVAKQEHNIDIKKKSSTPLSGDSRKKGKK